MKKLFLFLLILSSTHHCQGKLLSKERVDSLIIALDSRTYKRGDSVYLKLLLTISYEYNTIDPEKATKYCLLCLKLSEELKDSYYLAAAHNVLGNNYKQLGSHTEALQHFFTAMGFAESRNDKRYGYLRRSVYGNIGTLYQANKDYEKALTFYQKAAILFEQSGEKMLAAMEYANISIAMQSLGRFDSALIYIEKAKKIFENVGAVPPMLEADLNIASIYSDQKKYAEATEIYKQLIKKNETYHIVEIWSSIYCGMGLSLYNQAIEKELSYKMSNVQARAYLTAAAGSFHKAEEYLSQISNVGLAVECELKLASTDSALGNFEGAYIAEKKYLALRDSIFSSDKQVEMAKLETKHETALKQKQIAINELQQKQVKTERNVYVGGIVALLLVSGIMTGSFTKQRKTNKLLNTETAKSAALLVKKEELLSQKDMLMKEIHHRVKNNLQVIGTLLDLQLENISDEKARKALTEGMGRIKSIALIHQQLYNEDDLGSLEFSRFVKDLLNQIVSVFKKPGQHIAYNGDMPDTLLDIDTAVPLGLVLNELMTNSFKYAFDNGNDGAITMVLAAKGDLYEMRYTDSGPGLPAGHDMGKSGTLGMMVIASLAKQLGGSFIYDLVSKQFVITFKGREERKKVA